MADPEHRDRPENPPEDMELSSAAQLRVVLQRMDALEAKLAKTATPSLRLADGLSLLGIIIAVATVLATGLGLSARIDHVDTTAQHSAEVIGQKVDRLGQQISDLSQRLAVDEARSTPSRSGG